MAKAFLLDPAGLTARLRGRYRKARAEWLAGGGEWPLRVALGVPTEGEAAEHLRAVQAWQAAWAAWRGPGEVEWLERRWPSLGTQSLPATVRFAGPAAVAELLGEQAPWEQAAARYRSLAEQQPLLARLAPRHFEVLAGWSEAEYRRLLDMLGWLREHPESRLYPRQLPVPGVDSKWLEKRRAVVREWLAALSGQSPTTDLYALAGLRRPPPLLRMRLLDPALRHAVGGLGDISAPVEQLAALALPVERALIVENLQTGLALGELPGTVVFMGQGYAVEPFGELPWLRGLPCAYWGDLDSHGFAILDRLRAYLPQVRSVLMDEQTLTDWKSLWAEEETPASAAELPRLEAAEAALYRELRAGRFGRVRLEQERIPWDYALSRLQTLTDDRRSVPRP